MFLFLTDKESRIKIIKDYYRRHGGYGARLFSDTILRRGPAGERIAAGRGAILK